MAYAYRKCLLLAERDTNRKQYNENKLHFELRGLGRLHDSSSVRFRIPYPLASSCHETTDRYLKRIRFWTTGGYSYPLLPALF